MGVTTVVKDYGTAILNAIRDNDLKALRTIFEKYLKSEQKISALCTTDIKHKPTKKFACPLILAARQEDPSIIRYMMERGVDPNFVHRTIFTSKRKEIVTALHIAVDLSLFSTVEALLNANADPNITDHNDETSLHIAVKKADRVMTRMLLAKGADPSVLDRRGNAPLHVATLYGHLQLVKTLLKYDADVYQKGYLGAIPSHIAAREGHIHLVQVFCSRDVGNINIKIPCFADQREKAPIHLAAENGHVETVLALIDQFSAEVNLRDSDGNTPLHCTVLNPYHPYKMRDKDYFYATAKALVKYRVAINEKNKFGETALHLAAANQYQKIVELLLSVGANPFAENDQHLKPIDVVPESDPVTKQLLKNAMANPRTAPLSASMLSLQRDLNVSGMGFASAVNNHQRRLAPSMMMNGMPPQLGDPNRGSFPRSVSSMSSVFVDDIRARQGKPPKGLPPTVGEHHRARDEQQNEIQPYGTRGSRRGKHESRRHHGGDSSSIAGSQVSIDSVAKTGRERGERRHRDGRERSSSSTVERQNAKNEKRSRKNTADRPDEEDVFEPSTPEVTPTKSRHGKRDRHPVYENLKSHEASPTEESSRVRRERRKQEKQQHEKDAEMGLVPYGARNDYPYGDDEGVKVRTFPGKPSTIEVNYDRGPITISVDTQGNGFDALPPYGQLEQDSDLEFDWDEREDFEEEEEEPEDAGQRDKRKKKKSKHGVDDEDVEERGRKKHGKERDQDQVLEEMRRKQRQNELLKRRKSIEERETRVREEAERRREEQEEEERRARLEEEKTRRRTRKLNRRRQRQEQYEQEQEFEGMPTEEEPPERPFVVELPAEVQNELAIDSDSFEAEHETSRTAMIAATRRRVSATTESLKQRWSQDEDDEDRDEIIERLAGRSTAATGSGNGAPVAAKRPVKPPRPTVSQSGEELEGKEEVEQEIRQMEEEVKSTPVSGTDVKGQETQGIEATGQEVLGTEERPGSEVRAQEKPGTEVMGQEKPSTEVSRYQTYQTMLIETNPTDMIRMETVSALKETKPEDDVQKKKDQLLEYDEEPGFLSRRIDSSSSLSDAIRPGLNMRVTGEVPKAFTRQEKSSARKAFMLAAPVGIESSSEASDSEIYGSRSSLTRSPALEQLSAQRHKEWSEPLKPVYGNGTAGSGETAASTQQPGGSKYSSDARGKIIGSYAKPYESFGPIETKTDALEEAIEEAQRSLNSSMDVSGVDQYPRGKELSTFSANASTKANVDLSSEGGSQLARGQGLPGFKVGEVGAGSVQESHLPTILSTPTKISRQFHNVQETNVDSDSSGVQGVTSTVEGGAVPVVSHAKETDIVSTETDDDFFDDESFDDISEDDRLEEPSASTQKLEEQSLQSSTQQDEEVAPATKASTKAETSTGILSPVDLLHSPQAKRRAAGDLTMSTESLRSFSEDLEVYDQEPGARKPRGRNRGTESNDRVKGEDGRARDDKTTAAEPFDASGGDTKATVSTGERLPEDDEVALINSKAEVKRGMKKTKKNKKAESKPEAEETMKSIPGELGGVKEEVAKKATGKKKKKTKKMDLDVEFKPLASSEMFESAPSKSEHFMALNLQNETSGSSEIIGGSEGVVGELPKRAGKRKDDKKRKQLPKNTELMSELQKRFQQGPEALDEPEDDVPYSNSLDIVIPPIESKWKNLQDQSTDNSLDVSIPALDVKYFQMGSNAEVSSKWKPVKSRGGKLGVVNLDDIIIPRPSDFGDEDFFGQDVQKGERIVGRRQQRLTKQGLQKEMGKLPETNLDDLSSIDDQESSRTFDDESRDDESRTGRTKKKKKKGVAGKKPEEEDEASETRSLDSKVMEPSIDEDMDLLPPDAGTVPPDKTKVTVAPKGVVRPPKPQKPQTLSTGPTPLTKEEEKLPASSKPTPFKRQIQAIPNGWRSYSYGAEVVEVPSGEEGYRPVTEPIGMRRGQGGHVLPRFPPTPIGDGRSGVQSDTEISSRDQLRIGKYGRLGPVHSEAEASDLEMPIVPGPGKSYRQAALETINRRPRGHTFVLRQPGHHDKSFNYIRKLYKPQTRHSVTRHLLPTAGRYGDSELSRVTRRSATESEGDTDNEYSYLYNEERNRMVPQQRQGVPAMGRGRGKVVTIREGMTRGRPGYASRRDEAPRIMEPGPVDFRKYDVTARLWMEQVDLKTVQKSETMFLTVLPQGQELPEEIIRRAKYQSALAGDSSAVPLQWVMARGRAMAQKSRLAGEPRPDCGNLSGYESDLNLFQPSSSGRQLILFFKVGSNWLDLAWVLFDGVQGDSDTVRMIKDIQLKNPDRLTDQVHDLMQRWWKKKGSEATIDELQKALDTIHLAYIHEEYIDPRSSFVPHTDTEDELDVGEVSDADPNVSRIVQEYEVRSLNASFVADSGPQLPAEDLNAEAVLRQLQKARGVAPGSTAMYTRASRTSRAESRDSSFERSAGKPGASQDRLNESSGEERKQSVNDQQKLKKNFKHETNL